MLGFGILMAALGMVAAFPAAVALGVSSPSADGVRVPERVAALGGAFLVLLGGMKVLQQEGGMMLSGIDIAEGNVAIALIFGVLLPVVLEALSGPPPRARRPILDDRGRAGRRDPLGEPDAGCSRWPSSGGGLYFGPDGVAAMALGLAIWAVLAAGSTAASAAEEGLLTFRTLGLAPAFVALAVLLLPYKSFVLDVTRLQKQQVVLVLALSVALTLIVAGMLRNRWAAELAPADAQPAPCPEAAQPTE